jgi:hypothetical protein
VKTVWKIIKDTTGKTQSFHTITKINSEVGLVTDAKAIPNAFIILFIEITENLNTLVFIRLFSY